MSNTIRKFTIRKNPKRGYGQAIISGLGRKRRPVGLLTRLFGQRAKVWREYLALWPYVLALAVLGGSLAMLGLYIWVRQDLPDPNRIAVRSVAETSRIYDRDGEKILYEVHGNEKRTVVELEKISHYAIDAAIVAEDRDFYTHKGFKITGYLRALITNIRTGGRGQGGSTITQQLVKNALLSPEKTYTRKLKELLLSVQIERNFDKDTILKMYLNEIPYGSVVYGIESAAETFLGQKASDLDLADSALLAALPQSPSYLSPYGSHVDELIARQNWIIDSMVELGYVSQEEADEAKAKYPTSSEIEKSIRPKNVSILGPHFVFMVKELLAEQFGEQMVERGGLKIITTLDADKQAAAEQTINDNLDLLKQFDATNAALLSYDPATGDILAYVGSADYFNDEISGKYNVLQGLRQPGSSIKPIVYASAFEKGFTPDTVLYDVSTKFGSYAPKNYNLSEHGPMTMRESLAGSLNIPAVKTLYLAGLNDTVSLAERLGYTTFGNRDLFGLSFALGGAEVRPIEHIAAFSVFPNEGRVVPLRGILRVEDRNGKVLIDNSEPPSAGKPAISAETARQISGILSDNSARAYVFGESNYLVLPRQAAAKTGTTNNFKDAWTIGYAPNLVTGVWVGNSNGQEMKNGADGSRIAAPIWNAYMRQALEGMPVMGFTPPEPVITGKPVLDGSKVTQDTYRIDTVTGKLATEYTPEDKVEERGYGIPHSILYFVDRKDPRGAKPENPEDDPMFSAWEAGVAAWAESQGIQSETPPTEYDDVHLPENVPTVWFSRPGSDETVPSRSMYVDLTAQSGRGVREINFSIDGDHFAILYGPPFSGTLSIPNRFVKGFHMLNATASDDVGNLGYASVTFNLTADPGPIGIQWTRPYDRQIVYLSQFPIEVQFNIDDPRGIKTLSLDSVARNGDEDRIGSIDEPRLPNMSFSWMGPSSTGSYRLRVTVELDGGDSRSEEITVNVR
ncbi:MAG: transglycosylase domain-containing protein [bacterium]